TLDLPDGNVASDGEVASAADRDDRMVAGSAPGVRSDCPSGRTPFRPLRWLLVELHSFHPEHAFNPPGARDKFGTELDRITNPYRQSHSELRGGGRKRRDLPKS